MPNQITELAVVLTLAAVLGMAAKFFRQPLVLAYVVVGIVLGLAGFRPGSADPIFHMFSDLGVMLLLFLIGLEIRFTSLRLVGLPALLIGGGQIVITFAVGFMLSLLLQATPTVAAYIGIMLAFSSTIIVIKLISEKNDLNSLYGKLSIGVLLIQDFVAILLLIILNGWASGDGWHPSMILISLIKATVLVVMMIGIGRAVIPKIFDRIAHTPELVLVGSLAWLFLVVSVVRGLGLSIEIGGFLAGLALAHASESFHIAHRIKPLRDFFLLLFFVALGTTVTGTSAAGIGGWVVLLSLFVLVGKPIILFLLMTAMGYHRRTAFLSGITMGQVSEFSLVVAAVGMRLGHIDQRIVTITTLVLIVTMAGSSLGIVQAEQWYTRLRHLLKMFERRRRRHEETVDQRIRRSIILVGAHRTGQNILEHLPKNKVAIIDFDPDVVHYLRRRGWVSVYGDISDPDVFEPFQLSEVQLVISTSPIFEDNLTIVKTFQSRRQVMVIVRADNDQEARHLYRVGADYVLQPHFTSGQYLGHLLKTGHHRNILTQQRERDLKKLSTPSLS